MIVGVVDRLAGHTPVHLLGLFVRRKFFRRSHQSLERIAPRSCHRKIVVQGSEKIGIVDPHPVQQAFAVHLDLEKLVDIERCSVADDVVRVSRAEYVRADLRVGGKRLRCGMQIAAACIRMGCLEDMRDGLNLAHASCSIREPGAIFVFGRSGFVATLVRYFQLRIASFVNELGDGGAKDCGTISSFSIFVRHWMIPPVRPDEVEFVKLPQQLLLWERILQTTHAIFPICAFTPPARFHVRRSSPNRRKLVEFPKQRS